MLLITMGDARPAWDFAAPTDDRGTTFANLSFAAGTSRRAFRAMRWKPASKYGRKAVVKEYKDSFSWAQGDWDTAVKIYEKAKELARQFNEESQTNYPIHIVDYDVQEVIGQPAPNMTPKHGEFVLVEDYLEGNFQKFISNTGWVKPQCLTTYISMPAIAHWTWVRSNGQLMVTDLQGVRYSDNYVLTDPCILSLNREYGATDLALVGMVLFFISHKCNDICRSLNIAHMRPDVSGLEVFASMVKIPTSYLSQENYEKLPVEIRAKLRVVLLACLKIN